MKMTQDLPEGVNLITAYDTQQVWINHRPYLGHILLTNDQIQTDWTTANIEDIGLESILERLPKNPELLLLGSSIPMGARTLHWLASASVHKIGCEIMPRDAACRTYNILVNEGRYVAVALWQS